MSLLRPDQMVEHALLASRADGCVVLVEESTQANLRWASNTLTTNGQARQRWMTVVALNGEGPDTCAGAVSRCVGDTADIDTLVSMAELVASRTPPEESARPLVAGEAANDFADPPAQAGIDVFAGLAGSLGDVLGTAAGSDLLLYGYAEYVVATTYLGTSAGVRHRHVQPAGHLTMTAKSADLQSSTWVGQATRDFSDVDVHVMDRGLRRRIEWCRRSVDLAPGRHPTVLPPTAVADLAVSAYWEMAALTAHEGRTVYAQPGRGTRVGQRMVDPRVTLRSDPSYPGLGCAPVVMAAASGPTSSVFDNGIPVEPTRWVDHGTLTSLVQTRHSADLTSLPLTPAVDNLVLEVDGGAGDVDDLVARLDSGVLLTSLWYIREVDPRTLLLTGLTRDGVFVVDGGEVVGAATNFRFNESPIDILRRIRDAGSTVPSFSREWGEWFPRTATPPLTVEGFHFSTVSDAH